MLGLTNVIKMSTVILLAKKFAAKVYYCAPVSRMG